jgi:hypothetical protein
MKRVLERIVMFILAGIVLVTMLFLSCPVYSNSTQDMEINVWNKVSSDELNPGEIVPLDMSHGYSIADPMYIYIVLFEVLTGDTVVVVFPNGGEWTSPEPDPFLTELQKEFDSLEEYLRQKDSEEWKKN